MRNYTDSCGQQWVDNGMGWVPLGVSQEDHLPASRDERGRGWIRGGYRRPAGGGRWAPPTAGVVFPCGPGWYEESPIAPPVEFEGYRIEWKSTRSDGKNNCYRYVSTASPRYAERGAEPVVQRHNNVYTLDGRWYAPDGLGGTLVWNGAGWCRQ